MQPNDVAASLLILVPRMTASAFLDSYRFSISLSGKEQQTSVFRTKIDSGLPLVMASLKW